MLLHALTCPTQVVNAITVAAYKKFLLLSLLTQGTHPARLVRQGSAMVWWLPVSWQSVIARPVPAMHMSLTHHS